MDKSKIFIVQFYTNNVEYGPYSEEINSTYCQKHGYGYYVEKDDQKILNVLNFPERSHTWYKPKLILDVMQKFNPEYIMFLDIDACVVDFDQEIESYIDPEYDVVFTQDVGPHSSMNGGVFIVKNTDWIRNLMHMWWFSAETTKGADIPELNIPEEHKHRYGYFKTALWHDQSCLSHLYRSVPELQQKIKIISHRALNWQEPFDNNFVYHGFAYGHVPYRKLNAVRNKVLGIHEETPTDSLVELAKLYPTDKEYLHAYFSNVYQDNFYPIKNSIKKIVELGVSEGHSLMCWKSFFPHAQIIGLDINLDRYLFTGEDRISLEQVSGGSREMLNSFAERNRDIDIFIDDGGHTMDQQQITFATMFTAIKPGGLSVIEDLHTSVECKMPEKAIFGWGDPIKTTTLDMLEDFNRTGKIKSDYLTTEECRYLEHNIASCKIYHGTGPGIAAIITKIDDGDKVTQSQDVRELINSIINTALELKQTLETTTKLTDGEMPRVPRRDTSTMTLSDISKIYPTDKDFTHNYFNEVYEKYFSPLRESTKLICEIGIGGFDNTRGWAPGNSLRVMREYFPNAKILGLDITKYTLTDVDRITVDYMDQSNLTQVKEYASKLIGYDVILDDGSHNVYDQQITFVEFFKSLRSGGLYIIEDLHSSIEVNDPDKAKLWGWGDPGFITPLEMLEHFKKTNEIISDYLTIEDKQYLQDNIASVEVFHIAPTSITSIIVKK